MLGMITPPIHRIMLMRLPIIARLFHKINTFLQKIPKNLNVRKKRPVNTCFLAVRFPIVKMIIGQKIAK